LNFVCSDVNIIIFGTAEISPIILFNLFVNSGNKLPETMINAIRNFIFEKKFIASSTFRKNAVFEDIHNFHSCLYLNQSKYNQNFVHFEKD
jgi:hypothetical protein